VFGFSAFLVKRLFLFVGFTAILVATPLAAQDAPLSDDRVSSDTCALHLSKAPADLQLPGEFETARYAGMFIPVDADVQSSVLSAAFSTAGKNSLATQDIRRVLESDVTVHCDLDSAEACQALRARALAEQGSTSTLVSEDLLKRIHPFGFTGFSSLYVNPSAAGNWRRGGRAVKAVVPLNFSESLETGAWKEARWLMEYLAANDQERAALFSQAVSEQATWIPKHGSARFEAVAQGKLSRLIEAAQRNDKALSPLELKFAQIAVESARTGKYIHFDLWTSRSTHEAVRKAIKDFRANYAMNTFVLDPEVNAQIHECIRNYFGASDALHETHVLGYQEEISPIDSATQQYLIGEEKNGIGAGMVWHVLNVTGRSAQLRARGVRHGLFQNIEVLSFDLWAQFGAYLETGKEIGVVLVPLEPGASGGAPYWVSRNGIESMQLVEDVALPPGFKNGNFFFNTNTLFYPLGINSPTDIDFEKKPASDGRPMLVAKMSAGLVTANHSMGAIRGRNGFSYQDFKRAVDYEKKGHQTVHAFQKRLLESARAIK
jgi:hypothetical protein